MFDEILPTGPVDAFTALTALSLSFSLSQVLAIAYLVSSPRKKRSGFVVGLALGSIVTCMVMMAIGSSVAAGLGLAGGLSIIRFRTTLRDPRDLIFVFASLGLGLVCGLQAYAVALVGTAMFVLAGWSMTVSYGKPKLCKEDR
jgi:hypothetical protein